MYTGILHSRKKEGKDDTFQNMDGPSRHYAE